MKFPANVKLENIMREISKKEEEKTINEIVN
jgi:hypothetical protein